MAVGEVAIYADRGKLRLRWRTSKTGPKRYTLSPGLDDDQFDGGQQYKQALEIKAWIEDDIARGMFDPTLRRYSERRRSKTATFGQVYSLFLAEKRKQVEVRTMENYERLRRHQESHDYAQIAANEITNDRALTIRKLLRKTPNPNTGKCLSATTAGEHMSNLAAAWDWGLEQGFIDHGSNPWRKGRKSIKGGKIREAVVFSDDEIERIISTIQQHRHY